MARTANPAAYAIRRDAFLDVAERIVRTDGYDRLTIQDVLDELGASKGAFYHYFDSKEDLLEGVIARMADGAMAMIEPIVADPGLPATAKLQAVFSNVGRWKTQRSELLLGLVRSWYGPENDVVRLRLERLSRTRLAPFLARIVRQGTAEGVFTPTHPDEAATVLVALFAGTSDAVGRLLLDRQDGLIPFEAVERFMAAYSEAIERILGLPAGSFVIVDQDTMRHWYA